MNSFGASLRRGARCIWCFCHGMSKKVIFGCILAHCAVGTESAGSTSLKPFSTRWMCVLTDRSGCVFAL